MDDENYDGFVVAPDDDGNIDICFFDMKEEPYKGGVAIETTSMGEKFHVILFRHNEDNDLHFEESFEAIFSDPVYYAKSLLPKFYGMFLKKTDKSVEWFENYLQCMLLEIMKKKKNVKEMAESIANN